MALKIEEILSLLEASKFGDDVLSIRNNALIEILYATGGRISEIVELQLSDISEIRILSIVCCATPASNKRVEPELIVMEYISNWSPAAPNPVET